MRRAILVTLFLFTGYAQAEESSSCHIHKTHSINFRSYEVKDILELSVSPGPCATATMTLIIKSEYGEIFYTYAGRFAPHVTSDSADPNFHKFIDPFINNLITDAAKKSKDMPKYIRQDAANGFIKLHIKQKFYNDLRVRHLPLFYHPNNHNGWQYVMFDKKTGQGKLLVSGKYN